MLWLRRKQHETIVLGAGEIEIVIGPIAGDTVRVGIQAPDAVRIQRGEVFLAQARQAASVVDRLKNETEVGNVDVFAG